MKLYIPSLGDKIVLSKDWEFDLYWEERNHTLLNALDGVKHPSSHYWNFRWDDKPKPGPRKVVVPKGTTLTIDRIYIRKGNEDYSSITFKVGKADSPKPVFCNTRFWAKLDEANKIEFTAA